MNHKEDNITYFAKTNFRNEEKTFGIKTDDRRRHMYLIGKTGMGKTNLLKSMIVQDIQNGHSVAYLDPHGDTAEELLSFIPSNRINDVVYFNPSDVEYPIAFNILETIEGKEKKHLIASGLMGVFKKIWPDVWSARMEYILNNTILALLDFPGSTMLGINRMFSDKDYRRKVIDKVSDPVVRSFWINEFAKYTDKLASEATSSVQNKVGQFLSSSIIRNIIGQTKSTINMREIMDGNKILIVNLSKGKLGEDNMKLLGGMIITKLQLAAMERVDMPESERKDFFLYVDELQNFVNESFAGILSEARKYRLSLILAHQYIKQLPEVIRDAIFGNAGTLVTFRVGAEDAEYLEKEFEPTIMMNDIINLPKYHIYLKLMIDGITSNAFSATSLPPSENVEKSSMEKIIKVSRERYANPRAEVEERINRWIGFVSAREAVPTNGFSQRSSGNGQAPRANSDKPMFKVNCAECGAETFVPFQPDNRRPILCERCLKAARSSGKAFSYKKPDNTVAVTNPVRNAAPTPLSQTPPISTPPISVPQNNGASIKDALQKVADTSKEVSTKNRNRPVDVEGVRSLVQGVLSKRIENPEPKSLNPETRNQNPETRNRKNGELKEGEEVKFN